MCQNADSIKLHFDTPTIESEVVASDSWQQLRKNRIYFGCMQFWVKKYMFFELDREQMPFTVCR